MSPSRPASSRARRLGHSLPAIPGAASAISGIHDGHLALDELHPTVDVASYWEFDAPVWHRYGLPSHHLILVVAGELRAITPHGSFTAQAGDCLCFRPAAETQYGTDSMLHYFQAHVTFAPPPAHQRTPWLGPGGVLPLQQPLGERCEEARALFAAICQSCQAGGAADGLRLRAAVLNLLALIADVAVAHPTRRESLDPWQHARLRLESRLSEEISIAALARSLHVSEDHFIRRFRQRFGISPKRLRTQARLRLAATLLRAGDGPIKRIAHRVGLRDPTAFARLFRRYLGIAPSAIVGAQAVALPPPPPTAPGTLPVNQHLVAPGTPADWQEQFRPRR